MIANEFSEEACNRVDRTVLSINYVLGATIILLFTVVSVATNNHEGLFPFLAKKMFGGVSKNLIGTFHDVLLFGVYVIGILSAFIWRDTVHLGRKDNERFFWYIRAILSPVVGIITGAFIGVIMFIIAFICTNIITLTDSGITWVVMRIIQIF